MPTPATKPYRKLPGRGAASFRISRLWLGEDHLLLVHASSIGERYKRFYFADIQAFVLRRTARYWITAAVWLLTAAVAVTIGLFNEPPGRWIMLGLCVVPLAGFATHLFLGPTCACVVRTAVQAEDLPSLRRLRVAQRVIAQLRPLIEAAQTSPRESPNPQI